jgi:hypothetical protein
MRGIRLFPDLPRSLPMASARVWLSCIVTPAVSARFCGQAAR